MSEKKRSFKADDDDVLSTTSLVSSSTTAYLLKTALNEGATKVEIKEDKLHILVFKPRKRLRREVKTE